MIADRSKILAALAAFALLPAYLAAQSTGINGRVTDPSGSVIGNAVVVLSGEDGTKKTTISNAGGLYQFPSLRASTYLLRFEAPGFAPAERTLNLLIGQTPTVDMAMQLATSKSTVDVQDNATVIDTSSSSVAGDVSPAEVRKLPINGRNYLQLAMMVPGITSNSISTSPLGSTDSGKVQINVDGQQVTQNAAGTGFGQPQYSQDAIDQFQIITNRFDATAGRSSRVQVNVQTKAGTEQFHGTAYGYFRNDAFNASDPVSHTVLPFSDQQYGGTIGGPILHNKLYFFFGYEGERQPNTIFNTPTGFAGVSYSFPSKLSTNSYLFRSDWQVSNMHRISVRASGFTWSNPFNNVTGTSSPTRATDSSRTSYSILGLWTWTATPSLVNEFRGGLNHFDWANIPLVQSQEYRFQTITVGGPYNYPQNFIQNTQQYRDDLYWLKGTHSVKTGAEYLRSAYTGLFQQNIRGTVLSFSSDPANLPGIFPVWNDPSTWNIAAISPLANSYVQGFGNFNIDVPTNAIGTWIEDDWKVLPRLTLNLGLRYDADIGIFGPTAPIPNVRTPSFTSNSLFAPRFGFSYDPTGSRRTVIRGGAGMFYADIQANQTIDQQIFNGVTSLQPSIQARAGRPIDLTQPFGSTTGDQFLSGAVPINAQAIQVLAPNVRTPFSLQMSIGVEQQVRKDWTLSADFVHWRVYHDWVRGDANLFFNPATGYNKNPGTAGRPLSNYTNIQTFYTPDAAGSLSDALQVSIQRRFADRVTANIAYTFSRLKDSTTSPFYYPNNPFDFSKEWANSPDDQRHTLTTTGSFAWKYGLQLSGSFHYGSGQAFQTSVGANPFGYTPSANRIFPSTLRVYTPGSNVSPSGVAGYNLLARDSLRGTPIARLDMRLAKTFTIKDRFRLIPMIEAFNLFNHSNYGSFNTVASVASYGRPGRNADLAYAARMLQFVGRFEF